MRNLIAANAPWISNSFPYIRIVLVSLLIIFSFVLVIGIMMQPPNQEGVGAISGASDTFFSKNKGKSREGMLKRMTAVIAITMFALCLLYFISLAIDQTVIKKAAEETTEAIGKVL